MKSIVMTLTSITRLRTSSLIFTYELAKISPASSLKRGAHFAFAYCMYFFIVGTSSSPTPVVATRNAFSAMAAGVLLFPPVDDLLRVEAR
eukprot:scaffold112916_cov76-Cyclotella_meneghiniana.AAC.7